MRNKSGDIEESRKGSANVLAKIYEDPYSSRSDERRDEEDSDKRLKVIFLHSDDDEHN